MNVKLGLAPTRRNVFSKEDALKQKKIIENKLREWKINFVGLDWLNEEGLLFNEKDVPRIIEKFMSEKIDALFVPHVNFGTEDAVAKLAKALNVPVLLWGPRDEAPLSDGTRLRDTQCGLFATSKILRRFGVKFTYIVNTSVDDPVFERGFKNFIKTTFVVKTFRKMRIGVISTRPRDFWTVIHNEGELIEKFGIELVPTTLIDIVDSAQKILDSKEIEEEFENLKEKVDFSEIGEKHFKKVLTLKIAIKRWAEKMNLTAIAIQCWISLQKAFDIMPCFAHSLLFDEKLPVACETDVHGAISMVLAQSATLNSKPPFLADLTIRHPQNENVELLWHCGSFPLSLAKGKPKIGKHFILESHSPGVSEWEIVGGDISILRFDGDHGQYSVFVSHAKGTTGPYNRGTYLWIEFKNWPKIEEKIIYGPYIHHVAGIHEKIAPVIYEATKYLGIKFDPGEPDEEEIKAWLRGNVENI